MLTPLEKYFKVYSIYVLMVLGRKGRWYKEQGFNNKFVSAVRGVIYNRALRNEKSLSPHFPLCIKNTHKIMTCVILFIA